MIFKKVFFPLLAGFSSTLLFLAIFSATATASPQVTVTNQSPASIAQPSQIQSSAMITTVSIPANKDAFISSVAPDNNAGGSTGIAAGRTGVPSTRRGLIAFDIANNIPSEATILTATVSLEVIQTPSVGGVNSTFSLHNITTDWLEGTKTGNSGSPATIGEVTWNSAKHMTATWTTTGGDFVLTPSASTAVTGTGSYTWDSTSQIISDVQSWLDSPTTNYGWLLKSDDEVTQRTARLFGSREADIPAILEVTYSYTETRIFLPIIVSDG